MMSGPAGKGVYVWEGHIPAPGLLFDDPPCLDLMAHTD